MYTRRSITSCTVALLGGLGLLFPAADAAHAQQLSLAPTIGLYIPTSELIKAASGEEFRQEVSLSVGGRIGFWLGSRVGFEATAQYAPSTLTFSAAGLSDEASASILTGSGRLSFFIVPESQPLAILVSGGVGVIDRSGEAYADVENTRDITGTAGASARLRVGRIIHLQVNIEDYIYTPGFASESGVEGQIQHDIQLSFGVGIPLLGIGGGS